MSGITSAPRGLDGIIAVQTRLSHVDGRNGRLVIGGYELKERSSAAAGARLLIVD